MEVVMAHLIVQHFSEVMEKLRNMEDGVRKNSSDTSFASEIPIEVMEDLKNRLIASRNEYIESSKNTRLIHNEYKDVINEANDNLAKWQLFVQSKLGKKSRRLIDFGLLPIKSRNKSGKKPSSASPPSNAPQT
jgi:hypothetical protein